MNKKESKPKTEEPKEKKKKVAVAHFNFPPIDYEALTRVPTFTIEVRYAAGKATDSPVLDIAMPIDTTLSQIIELIEEKHNHSFKNVKVYFSKEDAVGKTYNFYLF